MARDTESDVGYAVGLDLGDGESSLCWLPTHGRSKARVYTRGTDGAAIVTALGRERLDQGGYRYVIGEAAVMAQNVLHFSVNFKSRPDPQDLAVPEAVQFAQILLTEFLSRHPEVRGDCVVYVGHPTGWDDVSVATYARHFSSMNVPVRLVAESQSALVHVRDRRGGRREERRLDRVLVVDIGSSTTDFTFVEDLIPRNLPVGSDLGCAVIDRELARMVREAFAGDEKFTRALGRDDSGEQMLLLACRRAKEAQFTGTDVRLQDLQVGCDPRFSPFLGPTLGWLRGVDVPGRVVRGPGGWAEAFADVLTEVRGLLGATQPELVVITGGGSRMPVARRLCLDAFPEATVESDTDPSQSVTRGLASVGRHRVNVARFRHDIHALKDRPDFEEKIRAGLLDAFDQARNTLLTRLLERADDGNADAEDEQDIDALIRRLTGMDQVLARLRVRLNAELTPMALEICRKYDIRDDQFMLELVLPGVIGTAISARIRPMWRTLRGAQSVLKTIGSMGGLGLYALRFATKNAKHVAQLGAMGAIAGGVLALPKATEMAARRLIRTTLENAQLDPTEVASVVTHVAEQITEQMDRRAQEVERFVSDTTQP
ncbi:Hsp70 family protein [Streptomyces sp. NPDC049627]|uniref:Hsp70 family protein n=1 Tax=Streptomyces sp. NPDC049627 TaxID=3365595 RepID=UPI00378E8E8B